METSTGEEAVIIFFCCSSLSPNTSSPVREQFVMSVIHNFKIRLGYSFLVMFKMMYFIYRYRIFFFYFSQFIITSGVTT